MSPRRSRLWTTALAAAAVLGAACVGARASDGFVLIFHDDLTSAHLGSDALPHLAALARGGQVAMMNAVVAGAPTDVAAALTLALGARETAEASDAATYGAYEVDVFERALAAVVFERRTGVRVPVHAPGPGEPASLVHLGIAPLARRGLAGRTVGAGAAGRLVFATDAPPGSPGRAYGLMAVGGDGTAPAAFIDIRGWTGEQVGRWANDAAGRGGVVVRVEGPASRLDQVVACLDTSATRVFVVSPRPTPEPDGRWRRLTAVVLAGPGVVPGTLTSATTRTDGLIANVDIAPTVREWLGVGPAVGQTGHALVGHPRSDATTAVASLDRSVRLNAASEVPAFVVIGGVGIVLAAAGLALVWLRPAWSRVAAVGILAMMNMPLAMLLAAGPLVAGSAPPPTPAGVAWYGALIGGLMLALALAQTAARRFGPPPALACAATALVVFADAVAGQPLVRFSLLSAYQASGIRFYGIGNEYMGVTVGAVLLAVFVLRASPAAALVAFCAAAVALGHPLLGADAGGLVTAVTAFGLALGALRGRRVRWTAVLAWLAASLALAFVVALLDRSAAGGAASHMGQALVASDEQGWQALWRIVERKALMNARIATHPGIIVGGAVLGAMLWLGGTALRGATTRVAALYPGWSAGLPVAAWAALIALALNDSGVVAAVFLFGLFAVSGLWMLLWHPDLVRGTGGAPGT